MARVASTPLNQDRYLEEHQRDICPSCRSWVPWYKDKKGKAVYGCQVGLIPYRDECPARKGKSSREVATVI